MTRPMTEGWTEPVNRPWGARPKCCGEIIGVERQGWYDGIAYWECMTCGKNFRRNEGVARFDALWERRLAELPFVSRAAVPE